MRPPGRISYVLAEAVGFDRVPAAVVDQLRERGVLAGSIWAGTADHPVTKRRSDGSHYQWIEAWWASTLRLVRFGAHRALAPVGGGKLTPAGPWEVRGAVHDYPYPIETTRSTWQFQVPAPSPGDRRHPRARSADPLEILPPQVAAPLFGAESDAWREWGKRWARETVVAFKMGEGRVLALRAERRTTSQATLDAAAWTVETVDAPIARSTPFASGSVPTVIS